MKHLMILLAVLLLVQTAYAQNCDPLLPCGPLPWQLPGLPNLQSPTPIPTMIYTAVPTATATGGPTLTPTSTPTVTTTPTALYDGTALAQQVGTLQAQINATPVSMFGFNGETVNTEHVTESSTLLWGYIKGLSLYDFGVFNALMVAWMVTFVFVIGFKVLMLVFPALMFLLGFLRRVVELILEFIPG